MREGADPEQGVVEIEQAPSHLDEEPVAPALFGGLAASGQLGLVDPGLSAGLAEAVDGHVEAVVVLRGLELHALGRQVVLTDCPCVQGLAALDRRSDALAVEM
jgi:hypothetical protein